MVALYEANFEGSVFEHVEPLKRIHADQEYTDQKEGWLGLVL